MNKMLFNALVGGGVVLFAISLLASAEAQAPIVPVPPVVEAGEIFSTNIEITWSEIEGAVTYTVYRNGANRGTTTDTSFIDYGLTPSTEYTFRVVAHNSAGQTANSAFFKVSTTSAPTSFSAPAPTYADTQTAIEDGTISIEKNNSRDDQIDISFVPKQVGVYSIEYGAFNTETVSVSSGQTDIRKDVPPITIGYGFDQDIIIYFREGTSDLVEVARAHVTTVPTPTPPPIKPGSFSVSGGVYSSFSVSFVPLKPGDFIIGHDGQTRTETIEDGDVGDKYTVHNIIKNRYGYDGDVTLSYDGKEIGSEPAPVAYFTMGQQVIQPEIFQTWQNKDNLLVTFNAYKHGVFTFGYDNGQTIDVTLVDDDAERLLLPFAVPVGYGYDGDVTLSYAGDVLVRVPITTGPAPPTLKLGDITPTSIEIAWDKVDDAIHYAFYRNGAYIILTPNLSYTDENLVPDTEYIYYVVSYEAAPFTSSATRFANLAATTASPIQTNSFSVTVDGDEASASFVPLIHGDFTIGYGAGQKIVIPIVEEIVGESFLFEGIQVGYGYSDVVTLSFGGVQIGSVPVTTGPSPPPPPTLVKGAVTPTSIVIEWTAPTGATGYELFRDDASLGTVTELFYTDTGLTPETIYIYHATSTNDISQTSEPSANLIAATSSTALPDTPIEIPATKAFFDVAISTDYVLLSFVPLKSGDFIIRYDTDQSITVSIADDELGETSSTVVPVGYNYDGDVSLSFGGVQIGSLSIRTQTVPPVLRVGEITPTSVVIEWDAVDGAIGYLLHNDPNAAHVDLNTITELSFDITGLTPGTSYTYYVRTVNPTGIGDGVQGSQFAELTVTTPTQAIVSDSFVITNPAAADTLLVTFTALQAGTFTITAGTLTDTVDVSAEDVTDAVEKQTTITVGFNFDDTVTLSFDSRQVATTRATTGSNPDAATTPAPPVLGEGTVTHNSIVIEWTAPTGATEYKLYRTDIDVPLTTTTELSYTDTTVTPGASYTYRAISTNAVGGASAFSEDLIVSTPLAPIELVTGEITPTSIEITWTKVEGTVVYSLIRSDSDEVVGVGDLFHTFTDLTPETVYIYSVVAFDGVTNVLATSANLVVSTSSTATPGTPIAIPPIVSDSFGVIAGVDDASVSFVPLKSGDFIIGYGTDQRTVSITNDELGETSTTIVPVGYNYDNPVTLSFGGVQVDSVSITTPPAPTEPFVTVTRPDTDTITVTWGNIPGTDYNIYAINEGEDPELIIDLVTSPHDITKDDSFFNKANNAEEIGVFGFSESNPVGGAVDNNNITSEEVPPVDTTAPPVPTITTPSATVGASPITIDGGSTEAGATITLFNGVTSAGTVTADGSGNFSFTGVALDEGTNSFTARASDGVNTSGPSPAIVITLDTIPPEAPIITTSSATVNTPSITIEGTAEAGTTIELFNGATSVDTVIADTGNFSFTRVALNPGTNSFTVTASDGPNTSAASSAIVITLDTEKPVITVLGSSETIELTQTNTYTIPDATVEDNDPAYSGTVTVTDDAPNSSVIGVYTVLYDAPADTAGNTPDQKSIVISIVDTTAPTFDVNGNTVDYSTAVPFDGTYTPGVIANESDISGIASSLVGGETVNANTSGEYTVTYTVTDNNEQSRTITETVTVGPEPTIDAVRNADNSVTVSWSNIETNISNEYVITISDGSSDSDTFTPTVVSNEFHITDTNIIDLNDANQVCVKGVGVDNKICEPVPEAFDTTAPSITVNEESFSIELGETYTAFTFAATDNTDGVITDDVSVGGDTVDTDTIGTYDVTFDVVDAAGNPAVTVTRTVTVTADTTVPSITVNEESFSIELGETYTPFTFAATDNTDGVITDDVSVGGDTVDTDTIGTYDVTFDVVDAAGNPAVTVTRTVTVTADTTAPSITVNEESFSVELGETYTPFTFAATDNTDGVITDDVSVGGNTVDTDTIGTYDVTFDVVDAAGNPAVTVTRTVTVTATTPPTPPDTEKPVITPAGSSETIELTQTNTYTIPDATVTDNDPAYSEDVTVSGATPDTSSIGVYTVLYNAPDDAAGNTPDQKSIVITVTDTTPPTFDVNGNTVDYSTAVPFDGTYTPGVIANESDISGTVPGIVGGETVNANTSGDYVVTYTVTDNNGLSTIITETVTVGPDTTAPPVPAITTPPTTVFSSPITIEGGSTEAGATIELFNGVTSAGTVIANDSGDFSFTEVALDEGENSFTATASDGVNTSDASSPVVITLDTTAVGSTASIPSETPKKKGGDSNEWKTKPTFGKHWNNQAVQLVDDGFVFNGMPLTITNNWHTDFNMTSSIIGDNNTVHIKGYATNGLKSVSLSLGVPEVGLKTNAESHIIVNVNSNYTSPAGYDIADIVHEQKEGLVNQNMTGASIDKVKCTSSDTAERCFDVTISFVIMAPLSHEVLAINAVDKQRYSTTTYINEGVEFTGEALLAAATHELKQKHGNQNPFETISLTQQDRRYQVWEDQYGYIWSQNDYGTWLQITRPDMQQRDDLPTSVMTRIHSNFASLVIDEQDRATLIFDSKAIQGTLDESFSYDMPLRLDRVSDPILLESLSIQEMLAQEMLCDCMIYDDSDLSWND